eukprot:m.45178 g.45178  ORF g.45178 m.45178 type:complete len:385 (-) comp10984_c0_seq1:180-1334(-)
MRLSLRRTLEILGGLAVLGLLSYVLWGGHQAPKATTEADLNALKEDYENMQALLTRLTGSLSREKQLVSQLSQELKESRETPIDVKPEHRLAILVPFRNAYDELRQFVPYMFKWLKKKGISFTIFIINQADDFRFNRGALLNVGYLMIEREYDYFAMHDVDLLPLNEQLNYSFPSEPFHMAAPWLHPIYHYPAFIGGIMLMSSVHYRALNGLSTHFWGWGREDDELFKRITEAGLHVLRPGNLSTGMYKTFRHLHDQEVRVRDMMKVGQQHVVGFQRDRVSGLNTTMHTIESVEARTVEGFPYIFVSTRIHCDLKATPWCVKPSVCQPGYYRHQPSNVCRRCGTNCWKGFVIFGNCTQTSNTLCKKIGRDISPEEAKKYVQGTM